MKEFIKRLGKKIQAVLKKIFGKTEEADDAFGLSVDKISEEIKKLFEDGELDSGVLKIDSDIKISEKFFNIPLTLLPKPYWCKTLIFTLAANQENDYQAVDMSQYEEHKIANFIVGCKKGWDEVLQEYLGEQKFETEEELEWLEEVRQVAEADGFYSGIVGEATLLHYEDLGIWDIDL